MREAKNYNDYLFNLVQRNAGNAARIIDFGAGSGTFALLCTALNVELTAVEPDQRLRTLLGEYGLKVVADTSALPDRSFDYAYSLNVLEHIHDDVEALRGLRSKLAANARALIYVPAFPLLFTSMDAKVGHVRRYTRATLTNAVTAAGFTVEDVRYADSLGFLAALAFKLVAKGTGDLDRRAVRLYDRLIFPMSRALDVLTHRWFGKNLVLLARNG
jgi:SAM-dependent methyltransferase